MNSIIRIINFLIVVSWTYHSKFLDIYKATGTLKGIKKGIACAEKTTQNVTIKEMNMCWKNEERTDSGLHNIIRITRRNMFKE